MIATAFNEDNIVLHPPEGVSSDEVQALSAFRGINSKGVPVIVSCWKVTDEELQSIIEHRKVWLVIAGNTMPPASVEGISPFIQVEKPDES